MISKFLIPFLKAMGISRLASLVQIGSNIGVELPERFSDSKTTKTFQKMWYFFKPLPEINMFLLKFLKFFSISSKKKSLSGTFHINAKHPAFH